MKSFYWDFFGVKVDPKKNFGASQQREKIFLGLLGGYGGMSPEKV